jgi:sarcosine oxidase subunit alpha
MALRVCRLRYGLLLREDGTVFDDGVVARLSDRHFLASPTSGHAEPVAALFERWHQTEWPQMKVALAPVTSNWATIAFSGPRSRELLGALAPDIGLDGGGLPYLGILAGSSAGVPFRVARVSFTGELQFEVSVPSRFGAALWRQALHAGRRFGALPVGMEAWLRLRIEKGYIHIGTDTDGRTTPGDLGLGAAIARKAADFIGKRSLSLAYPSGRDREQLVGVKAVGGAGLEPGGRVLAPGHHRPPAPTDGRVTSACYSRAAGGWIGLAMIQGGRSRLGERVTIHQSGHQVPAEIVAPLFHDPTGARMRA